MSAQAVIAVDGPNVLVTMGKLFGREAKLDYVMLREFLEQDARQRLATDDFDVNAAVFLQSSPPYSRQADAGPSEGRVRFERILSTSGWQVITKPPVDYPNDLVEVSRGLDQALSTRGYKAGREVERAFRELDSIGDTECSCVENTARTTLRESTQALNKVYAIHYKLPVRLVLRIVLPVLVRLCGFRSARKTLQKLLLEAWSNISLAERGQAEYVQQVREHLAVAHASPLQWSGKARDLRTSPADMNPVQLIDQAHRVRKALGAQRDELHRIGDVDDLLSEWVRCQIKPDLSDKSKLPAVVYLVGNDYRNHLVLAERLRRYEAQVVLVLQPCHLARTPIDKRSEVGKYPILHLDAFVDVGCTNKAAA